jgi:hypothetical protein
MKLGFDLCAHETAVHNFAEVPFWNREAWPSLRVLKP